MDRQTVRQADGRRYIKRVDIVFFLFLFTVLLDVRLWYIRNILEYLQYEHVNARVGRTYMSFSDIKLSNQTRRGAKEILITFKTRPGGRCQFNYGPGLSRHRDEFIFSGQRTIKKVRNESRLVIRTGGRKPLRDGIVLCMLIVSIVSGHFQIAFFGLSFKLQTKSQYFCKKLSIVFQRYCNQAQVRIRLKKVCLC